MAQPVWVTDAGSLGTIPEGIFYSVPLLAYDPADPDADNVFFRLIAGNLPEGVQIRDNGVLEGVPKTIAIVAGVPGQVGVDVTSKFTVRAYTVITVNSQQIVNRFRDRTFELTITGQDVPEFITPPGQLLQSYDGDWIRYQLQFDDGDLTDDVVVQVAAGTLPPGLTLSRTGLITGYVAPLEPIGAIPGFDRYGFDRYPFDFPKNSASTNFAFTIEITDGKSSNLRDFSIFIWARESFTADTTYITADNTFLTADISTQQPPIILNAEPDVRNQLGTYRNDNWFAYQLIGFDYDDDAITYITANDSAGDQLPPGLQLDPETGWLYGYIPNLGITELTYNFFVRVAKTFEPDVISNAYQFEINIIGPVDTDVTWLTDSDLGSIDNGSTSTLAIRAVNAAGRELLYRLKPGGYPVNDSVVYNKLPQGLSLLPSGIIAGRVSFNTFALDGGTTTFDNELNSFLTTDPTTFDLTCTFTVEAYSTDGLISVFKTFTVKVNREYNEPYNNLYIKAMPPIEDRALIDSLIQNSDIFKPNYIYRPDDANFGVAKSVIYWHAYGLTAATYADYVTSLSINHYLKNLTLGQIETARALDSNGNVLYEVVYSRIIDNLVNDQGQSVSKNLTLPYPVNNGNTFTTTVYPNSLINMRDQVIDSVGKVSEILPRWMTSKQENGRVLGFTPAWVIAYTQPGRSKEIAYNISEQFENQLNRVDFEVDRYELDRLLSIHWDSETEQWTPEPAETTFDSVLHYQITAFSPGLGYAIGDQITINGTAVGGVTGTNNIVLTVADVNQFGGITYIFVNQNVAPLLSSGNTYLAVTQTSTSGSGVGSSFDFEVGGGNLTTFDQSSMRFEAPVDQYTNTDAFDRYLIFPQRTILPIVGNNSPGVPWINGSGQIVSWVNSSGQLVYWVSST
jgi:hypothetical protein